jgi:hypothetical protein
MAKPTFFHKAASLKVLSEGFGNCHVGIGIWFELNQHTLDYQLKLQTSLGEGQK